MVPPLPADFGGVPTFPGFAFGGAGGGVGGGGGAAFGTAVTEPRVLPPLGTIEILNG